jgi:hypothetical protein
MKDAWRIDTRVTSCRWVTAVCVQELLISSSQLHRDDVLLFVCAAAAATKPKLPAQHAAHAPTFSARVLAASLRSVAASYLARAVAEPETRSRFSQSRPCENA